MNSLEISNKINTSRKKNDLKDTGSIFVDFWLTALFFLFLWGRTFHCFPDDELNTIVPVDLYYSENE